MYSLCVESWKQSFLACTLVFYLSARHRFLSSWLSIHLPSAHWTRNLYGRHFDDSLSVSWSRFSSNSLLESFEMIYKWWARLVEHHLSFLWRMTWTPIRQPCLIDWTSNHCSAMSWGIRISSRFSAIHVKQWANVRVTVRRALLNTTTICLSFRWMFVVSIDHWTSHVSANAIDVGLSLLIKHDWSSVFVHLWKLFANRKWHERLSSPLEFYSRSHEQMSCLCVCVRYCVVEGNYLFFAFEILLTRATRNQRSNPFRRLSWMKTAVHWCFSCCYFSYCSCCSFPFLFSL